MTDTSKDWRDVLSEFNDRSLRSIADEVSKLRSELSEALQNEQSSAEAYWEARGQLTRANERNAVLTEAIKDSIARADDCGDSWNSKPIRAALSGEPTKSSEGGE